MAQLTAHEIHSIEDKIQEGYSDSQIARFIHKERSIISRLFKRYPRDSFTALDVIQDRFRVKSEATKSHFRIEP
jgi:IS30 family transposase